MKAFTFIASLLCFAGLVACVPLELDGLGLCILAALLIVSFVGLSLEIKSKKI
jgi:hypothetical protein